MVWLDCDAPFTERTALLGRVGGTLSGGVADDFAEGLSAGIAIPAR